MTKTRRRRRIAAAAAQKAPSPFIRSSAMASISTSAANHRERLLETSSRCSHRDLRARAQLRGNKIVTARRHGRRKVRELEQVQRRRIRLEDKVLP
jgi:hypothetical protein